MVDGTSITDAALARKLSGAVARDAAFKVRISHDAKVTDRLAALRALVKKAGVTNVEVSAAIVTNVPPQPPPVRDDTPTIVLTIDASGRFALNARRVPDADLDKELASLGMRTKKIALTADKSTPYAAIVKLMDRCKAAGLTEIMFVAP
jgi:biopolymer transport protein ExbD